MPVEVPVDLKLEKAIVDLEEETGLRRELLVSKSLNLKVLRRLGAVKSKTARDFAFELVCCKEISQDNFDFKSEGLG